jgi:hypothetical protein
LTILGGIRLTVYGRQTRGGDFGERRAIVRRLGAFAAFGVSSARRDALCERVGRGPVGSPRLPEAEIVTGRP